MGSHDGYADAIIESGINLLNRENDPDLRSWIDSEIKVMFGMQKPDGIVEIWHGDGNFAERHSCMGYGKLKVHDFRHGIHLSETGQQPPIKEPILS